jgi:molybdate transport system permease protein
MVALMLAPLTPQEWSAIQLSLRVATTAALCGLPIGLLVAYVLARFRFPGRALFDGIVHLPLVMPPVVTGYLLLLALGRRGPVGAFLDRTFGIVLAFNWTGAALAAGIMGLPLMIRAMRLSLEAVDQRYEAAAATLGASRLTVLASITLPLMLPGILAGTVLAFARALGEFGATITFVGNIPGVTQTIPSAIYTYTQVPGGEAAALRLTLISVAIAFVALLASEALSRRASRRVLGQ